MKQIFEWYNNLSKRIRSSISYSLVIIGFVATIMTILGVSLNGMVQNNWLSLVIIIATFCAMFGFIYCIIGQIYKDSVSLRIRNTPVSVVCGDIFDTDGWIVIGCDNHFDLRVDDVVISKNSLHGKLMLEHGDCVEIIKAIQKEAKRLGLKADNDGVYTFPLGSIVRYKSSRDNKVYLMLAMTELDSDYKAHTNMAKFEYMLMKMWSEVDRVYARNTIVLPLLGTGITRFDDGPKEKKDLLKCMLCTLNASGVTLNADVKVVLHTDAKDIPFYEYKDMFRSIQTR